MLYIKGILFVGLYLSVGSIVTTFFEPNFLVESIIVMFSVYAVSVIITSDTFLYALVKQKLVGIGELNCTIINSGILDNKNEIKTKYLVLDRTLLSLIQKLSSGEIKMTPDMLSQLDDVVQDLLQVVVYCQKKK